MDNIMAIDVGTTAFKIGIFGRDLEPKGATSRLYDVTFHDRSMADIDPEKWWTALRESCAELRSLMASVGVVSLSVTTPGLVPMDEAGKALGPAILFLDGRSHTQAREIRRQVGEELFLAETCNLPVSGGSSLCSILWIKENQADVWNATGKFGHCNTYMAMRLTSRWGIDPSTTSITGLYNTARNDLTWNERVLAAAGIPETKLPPLMNSDARVGGVTRQVAAELGLPEGCDVLCGGNDAVLAAFSGGVRFPGDISAVHGTCDISCICVDKPIRSRNFNVRCHVVPGYWLAFFVLNTGGKALEWFHSVFCRDMTVDVFFDEYLPYVLGSFLGDDNVDKLEDDLPQYVPYLQGSRYSLEQMTASFSRLTLQTTREKMLLALIRGNLHLLGEHIAEVRELVNLGNRVSISGGAARIPGFLRAKKRWTGEFEYLFQDQSSLLGAAMLGQRHLNRR